jgi:hypothetical protein
LAIECIKCRDWPHVKANEDVFETQRGF